MVTWPSCALAATSFRLLAALHNTANATMVEAQSVVVPSLGYVVRIVPAAIRASLRMSMFVALEPPLVPMPQNWVKFAPEPVQTPGGNSRPVARIQRCDVLERPLRVIEPGLVVFVAATSPPASTVTLSPIVNSSHDATFAVIKPEKLTVMLAGLAKDDDALVYQMETVTPAAAAPWAFVNSRAFVQVLPAASVMLWWSFVFPF